jgi:hypothetical protein
MGVKYDFDLALMQGQENVRTRVDIFKLIVATKYFQGDPSGGELAAAASRRVMGKSVHVLCPLQIRWAAAGVGDNYNTYKEWLLLRLGQDYYIVELHTDKKNSGVLESKINDVKKNPWLWTDLSHTKALTVGDLAKDLLADLTKQTPGCAPAPVAAAPTPAAAPPPGSDYGNAQGSVDPYANIQPSVADDVRSTSVTRYPNTTGNPVNISSGGISYQITFR